MNSAKLVTIVGGTGFLGRQIVRRLARDGFRIKITSRKPARAYDLKPLGDVGQITLVKADIRHRDDIRSALAGADIVINLVGLLRPAGGANFEQVHETGAANVAMAAAEAGVKTLVHVSAIGASQQSASSYARTKAAGESAVRGIFPGAVIVRPSVVFGPGDGFFNMFARLISLSRVVFPLFGAGRTKFQPVYVGDVAEAIARILAKPEMRGRIFELGGPATYTLAELLSYISDIISRPRLFMPVPFFVLDTVAALTGWLPFAPITLDQAKLLRKDNIAKAGDDAMTVLTFGELGIEPKTLEAIVPSYLYVYRATGQYAEPHAT